LLRRSKTASNGNNWQSVFFDLFGSNKIASIDRHSATMAIKEYPLPDGASRPRRIAVSGDGAV
jgi:hypothetical protein